MSAMTADQDKVYLLEERRLRVLCNSLLFLCMARGRAAYCILECVPLPCALRRVVASYVECQCVVASKFAMWHERTCVFAGSCIVCCETSKDHNHRVCHRCSLNKLSRMRSGPLYRPKPRRRWRDEEPEHVFRQLFLHGFTTVPE